jgi:hypothetical protein
MKRNTTIKTAAVALALGLSSSAFAVSYNFTKISSNAPDDLGSQLAVDVTDAGSGKVDFKFTNNGSIASVIAQIYFDNTGGTLGAMITPFVDSGAGVSFSSGANPGNLPSGNNLNPDFVATAAASADNPAPSKGINNGATDWLTISFNLAATKSYQDVINALNLGPDNDSLRIGLHVTGIGTSGQSDAYVTEGNRVPDGGTTMTLLGMALLGLGAAQRRLA